MSGNLLPEAIVCSNEMKWPFTQFARYFGCFAIVSLLQRKD